MPKPKYTPALDQLKLLSINQTWQLLKNQGYRFSRERIQLAIRKGHLPAHIDEYRKDNFGQPRLFLYRRDIDHWVKQAYKRLTPEKGPP